MSECRECGEEVTWCRTGDGTMAVVQSDPMEGELVLIEEGDTHPTVRRRNPSYDPTHIGRDRYTWHSDLCAPIEDYFTVRPR